ncbi:hypothetical protein N3K66_000856 [Trichothecium roseum]|uniref:Uncharacterized protein n=1 Tax=Trichothecium roseum TaxID=47278 RepID=A0ACC0VEL1_9HYPO|nr:hypothetical protein N3K66_000856 [Trichothecium roseum]
MSSIEGINKVPFGLSGSLSVRDTCGSGKKECGVTDGCCDSDASCCGTSWCCPSGSTCLNKLSGTCCEEDKTKCGSTDCYDPDGGETCCRGEDSYLGGHCNKGESCCGLGCCPEGTHCKDDRCVKGNNAAMAQVLSRPWAMAGAAAWVLWYSAL